MVKSELMKTKKENEKLVRSLMVQERHEILGI